MYIFSADQEGGAAAQKTIENIVKEPEVGEVYTGKVVRIMDFGAFVDIGVHQDGLVHVSEMSERFIKHPLDVVKVGDVVDVKVLAVDVAKKRISLSMKL